MPIKKGTRVLEYTGPRLTNAEAEEIENYGGRYLFEVNSRWTIDGSPRSNIARYANHSCRPNMEAEIVKGRVMLRAIKHIEPGDEMTYNYGRDYREIFIPVCKCGNCGRPRNGRNGMGKKKNGHASRRG
jgi:SET domain-containing protein